jgi:hypothetical protein
MTGSGTVLDPYIITSLADLDNIRLDVTACYELGADIDATPTAGWDGGAGWTPIAAFTGTLDGKLHTITGLFINRPVTNLVALFASVQGVGTVQKVQMINVNITGRNYSGALCGELGISD